MFKTIDAFEGNRQDVSHLQHRSCPVCAGHRQRTVLAMTDFQFFTDSVVTAKRVDIQQVQCRQCLAVFMNPCYSEHGFAELFSEAGRSYGSSALRPAEQREWLADRALLRPGSVVLDVGCYDGGFLSYLPNNLQRHGVDIDGPAIERGRTRFPDLELVCSAFSDFEPTQAPQLITMFHVLEHLSDPVGVLSRLYQVASDDARLVVEVPVLEHGKTNDVNGFFSAGHVTHFSQQSLGNAMAMAGWQLTEAVMIEGYNGYRVVSRKATPRTSTSAHDGDVAATQEAMAAWYDAQRRVEEKLLALTDQHHIVLWGAGLHTEFLYQHTSLFMPPARRFMIVDSDPLKQGQTWRGIAIHAPQVLAQVDWQDCRLVISSYGGQDEISRAAGQLGVPDTQVLHLYDEVHVH